MRGNVTRRDGARRDLITLYRYHAREAGFRTADRFLAAAEATFLRLAALPGLGTQFDLENIPIDGLRYLPLGSPFQKFVVFYRPVEGGIEIVRVLHGARDISSVLADEFDQEDEEEADRG